MNADQREIRRKLRILQHAERIGDVSRTCRYFGVARASFYRWRQAYLRHGEAGLTNKRSTPHSHPNKTPPEVVDKICTCVANTTSGRSGSCGISNAITASKSPMPVFTAFSGVMA